MKLLAKIAAHLVYACGLIFLLILPSSKYDWMQSVDPTLSNIEDPSGNNLIFSLIVLVIAVLIQLGIASTTNSKKERNISHFLIALAIGFWVLWYW